MIKCYWVKMMEKLIEFLKGNKINYDIGIIRDNNSFSVSKSLKNKQVIKFKWKKNSISILLQKLKKRGVVLSLNVEGKYNALYNIKGISQQVLIEYAVDSHVQLPKLLLKQFRTGDYLYFLDSNKNQIIRSSARNYNTKFGYYSLFFEDYLSKNYEKIITEIIEIILPFVNGKKRIVSLKHWNDNVNKLFLMSIFRNPKLVEDINKQSKFAKLFAGGYDSEFIAYVGEKSKKFFIDGYKPIIIINKTEKGMVTLKSLIANLYIDNGVNAMIMLLHPKFAIALVPEKHYDKMLKEQGQQTYMLISINFEITKLNKQIYNTAKFNNEDVIGIKSDLEELIK